MSRSARLFLGGIIPGVVMTLFMMAVRHLLRAALRHGPRPGCSAGARSASTFVAALPALMTPVIIIGGMTFGWFTPTEAAIAACAWALLLGLLLYRSLSVKQFYKVTLDTIETTAGVLLIVARRLAVRLGPDDHAADRGRGRGAAVIHRKPLLILLLINVLLLVVGCFLEPIAAISILVPVLMPIITKVGIDPVHFGVMMTLNLMIGLLHPPFGMVLFVLSRDRQAVDRAHHHGDPAVPDPAARLAARYDADSRADAVAAAAGWLGQVAGYNRASRRQGHSSAVTAIACR